MTVEEIATVLLRGTALVVYEPKGTVYAIVGATLVKNDDGSWSDGVTYRADGGEHYTRKLTQLAKFRLATIEDLRNDTNH